MGILCLLALFASVALSMGQSFDQHCMDSISTSLPENYPVEQVHMLAGLVVSRHLAIDNVARNITIGICPREACGLPGAAGCETSAGQVHSLGQTNAMSIELINAHHFQSGISLTYSGGAPCPSAPSIQRSVQLSTYTAHSGAHHAC